MWLGDGFIIAVQRNAILPLGFELCDDEGPIDLTGYTIEIRVAKAQGEVSIIDIPCPIDDPVFGLFNTEIDGRVFNSVLGIKETIMLAFDMVADGGAGPVIIARGAIQLEPGVSA